MNNIEYGTIKFQMEEIRQVLEHKYPIFRSFSYLNPYDTYYDDFFGKWKHGVRNFIYKNISIGSKAFLKFCYAISNIAFFNFSYCDY